jgi:hypothetical protein
MSVRLADLKNPVSSQTVLYHGTIAEDASSVDDLVEVTIPAFDRNQKWGPASFMPRVDDDGDTVLPSKGDPCCVGLAETEEPGAHSVWIISWRPA